MRGPTCACRLHISDFRSLGDQVINLRGSTIPYYIRAVKLQITPECRFFISLPASLVSTSCNKVKLAHLQCVAVPGKN